jgi:hypothetical protein
MPSLQQLRDSNGGELPAFAWPGGYPMYYLAEDGEILCPDCANRKNDADAAWRLVGYDVHFEGPTLSCSHCGADIVSGSGDPDDNEGAPF